MRTFRSVCSVTVPPVVIIPTFKVSTLIASPYAVNVYVANDWSEAPRVTLADCESVFLTTVIVPALTVKAEGPNG